MLRINCRCSCNFVASPLLTFESSRMTHLSSLARACLPARRAADVDFCAAQKRFAVEVRHMNPILEAYASSANGSAAESLVDGMIAGQYAAPNVKSMELLAEVRYFGRSAAREASPTYSQECLLNL